MRQAALLLPALLFLTACTIPAPRESPAQTSSDETGTVMPPPETLILGASGSTLAERVLPSGLLEIGHPQAPVAFTLYTNHACAYCLQFEQVFTGPLLTDYVETGIVRLTVVPVPLQANPESARQTLLLSCALEQGKGWPMHRALFDGEPTDEQLMLMGIDADVLKACMASAGSGRLLPASNVTLVPSYAINGEMFTGLPEWPELRGQINAAL